MRAPTCLLALFLLHAQTSVRAEGCGGPLKPEVVQETSKGYGFQAKNVFILGERDAYWGENRYIYWLAGSKNQTGEGFTIKVDTCKRKIAGFQIKNKGQGTDAGIATKDFRVSGSISKDGPWETLWEDQLIDTKDTTGIRPVLLNFTFEEVVEIQFMEFELLSYWGPFRGGLQYFFPIPATEFEEPGTTEKEPGTTETEPGTTGEEPGTIVYYILISIPVTFTIFGLFYMCRTNCQIQKTCCPCCADLEKTDVNLDYGNYYDCDGRRMQNVMEMQDKNYAYETTRDPNKIEDYDYME